MRASGLTVEKLWGRSRWAASIGSHLRHIVRSADRFLTYTPDERLSEAQGRIAGPEKEPGNPPVDAASLVREAWLAIKRVLEVIRPLSRESCFDPRTIGRAALSTNGFGRMVVNDHAIGSGKRGAAMGGHEGG